MDSSISHDPFAPDDTTGGAAEPIAFREARFRAAGATEEEVEQYRADFMEWDDEEKAGANQIIDEVDDDQMRTWIEESRAEDEAEREAERLVAEQEEAERIQTAEEAERERVAAEVAAGSAESPAVVAPTGAEDNPAPDASEKKTNTARKATAKKS